MLFCPLLIFSNQLFFKDSFKDTIRVSVSIKIRPEVLGPNYQQTTKVAASKERVNDFEHLKIQSKAVFTILCIIHFPQMALSRRVKQGTAIVPISTML